ncbi:MAG TPA: ABC transporter substrate-binding protein [Firmicutes bacterium]|nr:ABC transporter substrate-binding protein [Bacillota bacterium]
MTRRSVAVVALALTAVLVLTGCSGGGAGSQGKESAKNLPDILIGNPQDLSSTNSAYGKGITNSAQMIFDKVNAEGGINGRKLKLVTYDVKLDVNEAINAYKRLCDQDKVVAVLAPPVSNQVLALAPIAEEKKVPLVGPFVDDRCTNPEPGKLWNYTFIMQQSSKQQAQALAAYAMNELKFKKFALLYNVGNSFSVSLAKPFMEYVKANGGQIVAEETFQFGDKDFRGQLTKIKAANPDAIYLPNYPAEIPLNIQQAKDLGIKAQLLGDNVCLPFALQAGEAAEGLIFHNSIDPNDPNNQEFIKAYKERYKIDPVPQAYSGYDSAMILVEAIKLAAKEGEITPASITRNLLNVKDMPGLQSKITLSPTTHKMIKPTVPILKIQNAQFICLTKYVSPE